MNESGRGWELPVGMQYLSFHLPAGIFQPRKHCLWPPAPLAGGYLQFAHPPVAPVMNTTAANHMVPLFANSIPLATLIH